MEGAGRGHGLGRPVSVRPTIALGHGSSLLANRPSSGGQVRRNQSVRKFGETQVTGWGGDPGNGQPIRGRGHGQYRGGAKARGGASRETIEVELIHPSDPPFNELAARYEEVPEQRMQNESVEPVPEPIVREEEVPGQAVAAGNNVPNVAEPVPGNSQPTTDSVDGKPRPAEDVKITRMGTKGDPAGIRRVRTTQGNWSYRRMHTTYKPTLEESQLNVTCTEEHVAGKSNHFSRKPFRIVERELLQAELEQEVMYVAEILCQPPPVVRNLLNFYEWDVQKVVERTQYGQRVVHLMDVGILLFPLDNLLESPPVSPNSARTNLKKCDQCRKPCTKMSPVLTNCGHTFCTPCFQGYLVSEVKVGDTSMIKCPVNLCIVLLDDDVITSNLPGQHLSAFEDLCQDEFIQRSKYRQICPSEGCRASSYVNVDKTNKRQKIVCKCGHKYCFGCGKNWHYPVDCGQLKEWTRAYSVIPLFSEIVNFNAETIPCPFCLKAVDKSRAVSTSSVVCESCKYTFCPSCFAEVNLTYFKKHSCADDNLIKHRPSLEPIRLLLGDYEAMERKFKIFGNGEDKIGTAESTNILNSSQTSLPREEILAKAMDYQRFLLHSFVFLYFLEISINKYEYVKALFKLQKELAGLFQEIAEGKDKLAVVKSMGSAELSYKKVLEILKEGFSYDLWHLRDVTGWSRSVLIPQHGHQSRY